MAEELLNLLILFNVVLAGLLFYCWLKLGQKADRVNKIFEEYTSLVLGGKRAFWKGLGAYETENDKMYLDLEGIRLVIFEGKIEGWYIP